MIITIHRGRKDRQKAAANLAMMLFDRARPDIAASGKYGEVFHAMRDLGVLIRQLYEESDRTGRDIDIRVGFARGLPTVERCTGGSPA